MISKSIVATALAVVISFASTSADAAMMAYLTVSGQKSGEIKGGITQKGRENSIGIIAVDQSSSMPFDVGSGLARGANVNGPLTITKELDVSTIGLRRAMAMNEVITKFELKFWAPSQRATGTGVEAQNFTITLKNARIIGYRFHMPNIRNPDLMKYSEYEEISFSYESITYTWVEGGVTFQDTWISKP